MSTFRLEKVATFWQRFSFVSNVGKIRNTLMNYLKDEGIECELKDGDIRFRFKDCDFTASIFVHEGFSECLIMHNCTDEAYANLSTEDKTLIADKANIEEITHATTLAFGDTLKCFTSFYFTSKDIFLRLFAIHFEELGDSMERAFSLLEDCLSEHAELKNRQIGFHVDAPVNPETEQEENAHVAKK